MKKGRHGISHNGPRASGDAHPLSAATPRVVVRQLFREQFGALYVPFPASLIYLAEIFWRQREIGAGDEPAGFGALDQFDHPHKLSSHAIELVEDFRDDRVPALRLVVEALGDLAMLSPS
jgi:hypothetical protein